MSSSIDSNTKGQNVLCEICHQVRSFKKYRRHLRFHFRRGEVSLNRISEIIFDTKKQRYNTKSSGANIPKNGRICPLLVNGVECGAITLDLSAHLTRYHGVSKNEDSYISLMKSARFIHRQNFKYMDNS